MILQLDVFLNGRTKQKTENTVTFSHFYQNELEILNTINHTVNVDAIELLWGTVETLSSRQYTP